MGQENAGFPDAQFWKERADELRPTLEELQRRADVGELPPADDIDEVIREILPNAELTDSPPDPEVHS